MYMPVDVMMEHPESLSNQNELDYFQELRKRLEDAYPELTGRRGTIM